MRKIFTAVGITGSLFAGLMRSGTGVAHAFYDGTTPRPAFLAHIHALGFNSDPAYDAAYVRVGHNICHTLQGGFTIVAVQGEIETELAPKGYTAAEADGLATYAREDLCPSVGR
jgi:hypothetical protein